MARFEFDPSKLVVNDVDLSGHLYNVDMSHDAGEKGAWGEKLAGPKESSLSMTFDNSGGYFEPTGSPFFAAPEPKIRVIHEVTDGKWQAFKQRLKFWRLWSWQPLNRLKVRYVRHSFDAVLEPWWDGASFVVQGRSDGPMSKGTETR